MTEGWDEQASNLTIVSDDVAGMPRTGAMHAPSEVGVVARALARFEAIAAVVCDGQPTGDPCHAATIDGTDVTRGLRHGHGARRLMGSADALSRFATVTWNAGNGVLRTHGVQAVTDGLVQATFSLLLDDGMRPALVPTHVRPGLDRRQLAQWTRAADRFAKADGARFVWMTWDRVEIDLERIRRRIKAIRHPRHGEPERRARIIRELEARQGTLTTARERLFDHLKSDTKAFDFATIEVDVGRGTFGTLPAAASLRGAVRTARSGSCVTVRGGAVAFDLADLADLGCRVTVVSSNSHLKPRWDRRDVGAVEVWEPVALHGLAAVGWLGPDDVVVVDLASPTVVAAEEVTSTLAALGRDPVVVALSPDQVHVGRSSGLAAALGPAFDAVHHQEAPTPPGPPSTRPSGDPTGVVRVLRDRGMTVADLAATARASRSTVHAWLGNGATEATPPEGLVRLVALQDATGTAGRDLWRFAGRPSPSGPSLRELLARDVLDEAALTEALLALAPLMRRETRGAAVRIRSGRGAANPVLDAIPVASARRGR